MLAPLRNQGNHGTIIDPHRSIATVRLTRGDVLLAAALAVAASAALVMNLGTIGNLWTWIYLRLAAPLGFTGGVGQRTFETPLVADVTVPYFNMSAPLPSESVWWVALVITALVLLVSLVLPPSWLPFAYLLRLVVLVQCTALAFFRLAPSRFPYNLSQYMSAMLAAGMAVMLVIPVLLALTFYVVDVGVLRKIVLTVAMLGHLLLFVPLQYAVHAWLVVHGTLLLLPVLFMLFGLLPEVMVLIALYGWGMSWRAQRARTRRE